jgi:hypothetical protein
MSVPGAAEAAEQSRFFEYGEVLLTENDYKTRQAAVSVCMPCCLFQAVTPSLLGGGLVDGLKVREPLAVWLPQLTSERVSPLVRAQVPDAEIRINAVMKAHVDELLRLFQGASGVIVDPADLVPYLPLGTYVCFRFRCRIDDVPKVLEGVDRTPVTGVPEFQWALAMVLKCALEDHARHEAVVARRLVQIG